MDARLPDPDAQNELLRYMKERDAKRKRTWRIVGLIVGAVLVIGAPIVLVMKTNADERRAHDERVQIVTDAINASD